MATPSSSFAKDQRRVSDQGAIRTVPHEQEPRRRTIGGAPRTKTPAKTPGKTPSKHRLHLGSSAASSYYFSDLPKTPHSVVKAPTIATRDGSIPEVQGDDTKTGDDTANLADISMLSMGTSSTEGSDLLNRSVLSDTTELTASNFVLQATSRQRILELSRPEKAEAIHASTENTESHIPPKDVTKNDVGAVQRDPLKPLNYSESGRTAQHQSVPANDNSLAPPQVPSEKAETVPASTAKTHKDLSEGQQRDPLKPSDDNESVPVAQIRPVPPDGKSRASLSIPHSPFLQKKFKGMSPAGLSMATESLRKGKEASDETRRRSLGIIRSGIDTQFPETNRHSFSGTTALARPPLAFGSRSVSQNPEFLSLQASLSIPDQSSLVETGSENLDDLLKSIDDDSSAKETARNSSVEATANNQFSPSSTIASTSSHIDKPEDPKIPSKSDAVSSEEVNREESGEMLSPGEDPFSSPQSTYAEQGSSIRLTPNSYETKLTPTHLSPSPRRVPNPASLDSPARNTRSAKRKADNSPAKKSLSAEFESSAEGKRPRSEDSEVENVTTVAYSSSREAEGRVSELSLGTLLSDGASSPTNRRRSSVSSTSTANVEDVNLLLGLGENSVRPDPEAAQGHSLKSPSPLVAKVPKSILNSSKKLKSLTKKAVVFRSPEAAEYRIGSPSVSLTPMPKGEAKAKYVIPRTHTSPSSTASSDHSMLVSDDSGTIEIETDLGTLLQTVREGKHDNGTPEEAVKQQTGTVSDPSLLVCAPEESGQSDKSPSKPSPSISSVSNESKDSELQQQDPTVELETDVHALLSNALNSPGSSSASPSPLISTNKNTSIGSNEADSVEMADGESVKSIASAGSKPDFYISAASDAQTLSFDSMTSQTNPASESKLLATRDDEEDNTVELEASLTTLLATAGIEKTSYSREAPVPSRLSDKFPKMASTIAPTTNRMSFGESVAAASETENRAGSFVLFDDKSTDVASTKELETDMETLLKTAERSGAAEVMPVLSQSPSESRRKSSHRFSLTPGSNLSVSMDGSIALNSTTLSVDEVATVEQCPTSAGSTTANTVDEVFDVTDIEIYDAAGLSLHQEAGIAKNDGDITSDVDLVSQELKNRFISRNLADFISAVCGEVEGRVAVIDAESSSSLGAVADRKPEQMLQLQKALRSSDEGALKQKLRHLAKNAERFVDFEWATWEAEVSKLLPQTLEAIDHELDDDDGQVQSSAILGQKAVEAMSYMQGRAARRARRRSLTRRKNASSALEDEIRDLEAKLADSREKFDAVLADEASTFEAKTALLTRSSVDSSLQNWIRIAGSGHRTFTNLHGLHSWSPVTIEETRVTVAFVGASPKTCVKVCFNIPKSGTIECESVRDSSYFRHHRGKALKHTPLTSKYLEANMKAILEETNGKFLQSPSSIREVLQRLELAIGRFETNANEIFMLQKKYRTALELDPEGKQTDFLLSIDFANRSKSAALRATFELHSSYPFSSLGISLDDYKGKTDVEELERQLRKHTKPGFGYLSRTCDTMLAFMK